MSKQNISIKTTDFTAFAAAVGSLLLVGSPVRAQENLGAGYSNLASSTLSTMMINNVIAGTARPLSPSKGKIAVRGASGAATTTYRATPAVTEKVKKQYLDWVRKQYPQEADKMQAIFAEHNPIGIWSGLVKEDGLHTGNVSDAFAAYWILNYLIATQGKDTTPGQAQAVRNQIQPVMAKNPAFARFTQAERQEAAEVWMINFVVQQGAYAAAMKSGDTVMLQKLGDAAAARFQKEMQIDLRGMTLTDKGFAPKKG